MVKIRNCFFFTIVAACLLLAFSVQANNPVKQKEIVKKEVTEKRTVPVFEGLNIAGDYTITIMNGLAQSVAVSAAKDVLPNVITEVKDKILYIYPPAKLTSGATKPAKIAITLPSLQSLSVAGANIISIQQIKGDKLVITTSGKQELELLGEIKEFTADLTGANVLNAEKLIANKLTLNAAGFAQVKIHAAQEFHVHTAGDISIKLFGNPKIVTTSMLGGGKLELSN